ncbi:MAG: hypothetical protein O3C40_01690 [Planctomycetota bacterium]|nr:hypothetical protein [Planctomycetota bacterium]
MSSVSIFPIVVDDGGTIYRAVCGEHRSSGKTAGEALDAIRKQLTGDERNTMVVLQEREPDQFFPVESQVRLRQLMSGWRQARDTGVSFDAGLQSELDALIDAELVAATERSRQALRDATA